MTRRKITSPPILRKHPYFAAFILLASTALAFQTARTLTQPPQNTRPLATLTPPGALLSIESPDFAALLNSWNTSPQQKAWLASANYSVFSNSRLFGRLTDAETQFAAASQIPAATLLPQVAGHQSLFAWYDISNLEFLYITRMPAAQAAQTDLLKSRGKWQQRVSGGIPFYIRTSGNGADTPRRTVAFASTSGLFFVATREDLLANALQLLNPASQQASLATEPWFTQASATLKASAASGQGSPILHMVLDLQRIVPMAQFRTYWVQQNITQFKQYRSAVSDLYNEPGAFHEERAMLLANPDAAQLADPDLAPLAALAPPSGVFRATATTVPADAVAAIEEKLLGAAVPNATSYDAPDPSLTPTQAGDTTDLDTRIDTPAPTSATASNQALAAALQSSGFDELLTYSAAGNPAQTPGATKLWVPIHSAVVLHGAGSWKPEAIAQALQNSLRGTLTTSTLGIDFHPSANAGTPVYALSGPKPLFFAIQGSYLFLADDQPLLTSLLTPASANGPATIHATIPATLIAGFNHTAQRAPYARLTSLIDGTNTKPVPASAPDPVAPPAFFSGNVRSLSDAFAALQSERLTEHPPQTPEPPTVRITILSLFQPHTLILTANQTTLTIRSAQTPYTLPSTHFTLTVPGKLTRQYTGALTITSQAGILTAILTLPTELAVASIVAAESPADAPLESLKTQAVASRSYLLANLQPQSTADSCDTTRCQFLRSPPTPQSPAAQATLATRNQVLTWRASPDVPASIVPAMYSRSCGGHTHAHPTAPGTYPFYSVRCEYCLRHPELWSRQAPPTSLTTEQDRVAYNRLHGWSAIPSNTHTQTGDGMLEGRGTGHGIGLCQLGAQDLARRGQPYPTILAHFFPNTTLTTLPELLH